MANCQLVAEICYTSTSVSRYSGGPWISCCFIVPSEWMRGKGGLEQSPAAWSKAAQECECVVLRAFSKQIERGHHIELRFLRRAQHEKT